MPGKSLPVLSASDVAQHNSSKSCYVTVGRKVYDVTSFLGDHPGGDDLILDWAGKDVSAILKDELSHTHSEAAYEILDDYLVGIIRPETNGATTNGVTTNGTYKSAVNGDTNGATNGVTNGVPAKRPAFESTGLSCAEELSIDTDLNADFKTHHFLDLNRPLLPQLWTSGFSKRFYLEQVHRPRHYKGGASAPLFGNFLEPLSKTAWWVVPTVWLPAVAYGTYIGMQGFKHNILAGAAYWSFGVFCWTLVEYFLHRFLFHIDKYVPSLPLGLYFLLLLLHHVLPLLWLIPKQVPPRQPGRHHSAFPPPRHPPLLAHGQVPPRHAAGAVPDPGQSVVPRRAHDSVLQLVCRRSWLHWRRLRLHLL